MAAKGKTLMKNGLENHYIIKDNKKLYFGYTTGSCAAGAAKAAAVMLFTGQDIRQADLMTPRGILLHLEVEDIRREQGQVSCAIRKDGGDDPDATHGMLVYASVKKSQGTGISIDGGAGVGRVTRKGLEQPVGAAAINRVPRQMIRESVEEVCQEHGYQGGVEVVISIPGGEERAQKTFNPRLGIEGGLSVLGTSGIVVPMSEEALIASIRLEMEMHHAQGREYLLITPGNYGEEFVRENMKLDLENSMKCSNYVGETLDMAAGMGIRGILFVAHIGKFIKVSGGIMNTHSRSADCRAELMAAAALRAGADAGLAGRILGTVTTEEAVKLLKDEKMLEQTVGEVCAKVHFYLQNRCQGTMETEAVLFSNSLGYLGETQGARKLMARLTKRAPVKE